MADQLATETDDMQPLLQEISALIAQSRHTLKLLIVAKVFAQKSHSRASGNPVPAWCLWIPACAGITAKLMQQLIRNQFGKGFDVSNLRNMRRFYQAFPIQDAVRPELGFLVPMLPRGNAYGALAQFQCQKSPRAGLVTGGVSSMVNQACIPTQEHGNQSHDAGVTHGKNEDS